MMTEKEVQAELERHGIELKDALAKRNALIRLDENAATMSMLLQSCAGQCIGYKTKQTKNKGKANANERTAR